MSNRPEGPLARIRQIRRTGPPSAAETRPPREPVTEPDQVADLRTRVTHLEQMLQGLQDSVYRESQRQEKRLTDLEARIDPAALAAALSKDARERGL